jgi:membrane-bound lytic murein transglycosylase D
MKLISCTALLCLLCLGGCASNGAIAPAAIQVVNADAFMVASTAIPDEPPPQAIATDIPSGTLTPITAAQTDSRDVATLSAPKDLWDRIRRGFGMPDLQSKLVPDREQWYAGRPDDIERMTERSRKYLFHIVEEIERRNMPTELALLPFIESAFNPQALSSAKAVGMWQFIPSTGKRYALKQNAFRDDRRDVLASTRAALDYLQKLHDMFGDWHLALAAYNWGEGSVARAIAKNQRNHLGTDYLDLNMPMETRFYIPKLQAMKNIVANPENFGVELPHIENHPFFESVLIRRDIDVSLAAKFAEMPVDAFRALNPSLHRPVILAAGTPQILLPRDNAEIFQRNLDAAAGTRLASWTVWIAPTSMKPADAAKRIGMSEADLRYVNRIPPNMTIRAGSTLLVPRPARQERDVTMRIADGGQLALAPDLVERRFVFKAGKNESVASFAKRYRVNPVKLAEWNKVSTTATFRQFQEVLVYRMVPVNSTVRKAPLRRQPTKSATRNKPTQVAKR